MCRSKTEGGRRCPGGSAAAGRPPAGREGTAQDRWSEAERALAAAKAEVGPVGDDPSYLLLGPLSRQAAHADGGGDPSVYDDQVAEGRAMLIGLLTGHGDDPGAAAAKADALAAAYARWSATPEA